MNDMHDAAPDAAEPADAATPASSLEHEAPPSNAAAVEHEAPPSPAPAVEHDAPPSPAPAVEHEAPPSLAPAVEHEALPSNADSAALPADAASPPVTTAVEVGDPSALGVHPAAALFPMLADDELELLASDIAAHGLLTPIVIHAGLILDGRNRLRACALASVAPRFVDWAGTGSVSAWVFSLNLRRRHLTPSQRAMLAARAVEMFVAEARARKESGREVENAGKAREKAAELFGVGYGSVHRAHTVLAHAVPELVTAVDAGDVAVGAAADIASLPSAEQLAALRRKMVAERATDIRPDPVRARTETPASPSRSATPPPSPLPSAPASLSRPATPPPSPLPSSDLSSAPAATLAAPSSEEDPPESSEAAEANEGSMLLPELRPDPQPLYMPAFKQGRRDGSCPRDEAAKVAQILETARSALYAWRWLVIEWKEDKRWDMKFALHEAGPIAIGLQHAVDRLEAIGDMCSGRKPTPPPETP